VTSHLLRFALAFAALSATALAGGVPPVAGDLAISELAFNPGPEACVTDANGEYFEVVNISTKALDLNGVFFQDESTLATGSFFVVPAATLPTLFPGQRFLFARLGNSSLNGGLPAIDYVYSTGDMTTPADNSLVNNATMLFNNTGTDGLHITVGGPKTVPTPNPNGYLAGTEIEAFTYAGGAAPFLPVVSATQPAAERINLFATVLQAAGVNSANVAAATGTYGSCGDKGSPDAANAADATVWPAAFATTFTDSLAENTGVLALESPATVGRGTVTFRSSNGPAGTLFTLGYSNAPSEIPISLILPGNPGSILLSLGGAVFISDASLLFDGAGVCHTSLPIPPVPGFIGLSVPFQWLGFDGVSFLLVASNGLNMTFVE